MTDNVTEVAFKLDFEVIIDESFTEHVVDKTLTPITNKKVLSVINDFEDGEWRYQRFQNFIWDNIVETALSFKERNSLVNKTHTLLVEAAKNLRLTDKEKDDIGKGSELAEIVLYGIMKNHYGALSVVPKIFYKQSAQDNAKGSDSVHIVVEGPDDFSLWFGEAKFYNSIEDVRLTEIVSSVDKSLQTDKLKKENSIITNVSDLDEVIKDEKLKGKIKDALSSGASMDNLKSKLHIPILLLHECTITQGHKTLTDEYKNEIRDFHKKRSEAYFKKQLTKCKDLHMYDEIKFHLILFPVPKKEIIVDKFVSNVEHFKGQ